MTPNDEKIDKFQSAIHHYATQQRNKILQEVEAYRSRVLEQARQEALHETRGLIQQERAQTKNRILREMALREQEVRRDLLTRRQEITEEVFQKAKDALRAFAASEAYAAFLERAAQEAAALFTAGDTVFCMRPEDSKWQKTVQKAFGAPCTFAQDGKIHLGGFVVRSKSLGLAADQTLDAMLEDQRAWFEANAGLSIE